MAGTCRASYEYTIVSLLFSFCFYARRTGHTRYGTAAASTFIQRSNHLSTSEKVPPCLFCFFLLIPSASIVFALLVLFPPPPYSNPEPRSLVTVRGLFSPLRTTTSQLYGTSTCLHFAMACKTAALSSLVDSHRTAPAPSAVDSLDFFIIENIKTQKSDRHIRLKLHNQLCVGN